MELDDVAVAINPAGATGTVVQDDPTVAPPPVELLITVSTAGVLVTMPFPLGTVTLRRCRYLWQSLAAWYRQLR
jgi:hypothetical protein